METENTIKVICINNKLNKSDEEVIENYYIPKFTLNKQYEIEFLKTDLYKHLCWITDDDNHIILTHRYLFKTLDEIRNDKLNQLLNFYSLEL